MSAFVASVIVVCAAPASAQLFEISRVDQSPVTDIASEAAYDPVHDCYFVITGNPTVAGQFVDRSGRPLGPTVTLDRRSFGGPSFLNTRTVYSPDVVGGQGGFLVIWSSRTKMEVALLAAIVTFPGLLTTGPQRVDFRPLVDITGGGVAYSPTDHVFLVAVQYFATATLFRLDLEGQPLDQRPLSIPPDASCTGPQLFSCDIQVAWNPLAQEFGVLYSQGASTSTASERVLARVQGDGTIVSRVMTGLLGGFYSALAVNERTGNYLAISNEGVELGPDGAILSRGAVAPNLTFQTISSDTLSSLRLSYSPASGTFLLAGHVVPPSDFGGFLELNQHGVPLSPMFSMPHWWFAVASHPTAPEWIVAIRDRTSIIGTTSRFGGSDAVLSGCSTPDPFVSLGGGRCVNRGWLPPGHPLIPADTPPPPTPPPSGGCTIPDPFTSIGGGVCVNGGWVPHGHPLAGGGL
jgi:hypothetical protein